jgi:ribosomal protein S27E
MGRSPMTATAGRVWLGDVPALHVSALGSDDRTRGFVVACGTTDRRRIQLEVTVQAIGGSRLWLLCPDCGKRRTWLSILPDRVTCRVCGRLAYLSQGLSDHNRRSLSAERIYDRINVRCNSSEREQGKKPRGQHWRTYWRLYDKARSIDPRPITEHYRHGRGLGLRATDTTGGIEIE